MVAATVICGVAGCRRHGGDAREPQAYVTFAQMQKRIFQKHLPAKGIVHPIDSAIISAQTEGMLVNMNIVEGDYAKAGDVLFCTDRSNLEALASIRKDEVEILESVVERAKIKAETAELTFRQLERDYERERKLREANVNSQAGFEAAETPTAKPPLTSRTPKSTSSRRRRVSKKRVAIWTPPCGIWNTHCTKHLTTAS